jgi:hypothetical protein
MSAQELVQEGARINKELHYILRQGSVVAEVPLRLHSRETDAGGAPEFHPAFLKYLGNATVCNCGRKAVCAPNCHFNRDRVLGHLDACEPACGGDTRFYRSKHKGSPTRLKRGLNQVRRLNPKAYDFLYLVVALHFSFEDAAERLNADKVRRGQPEMTHAEYAVVWLSASSMLAASF